jgi:hypothetical protein
MGLARHDAEKAGVEPGDIVDEAGLAGASR